jgi:hypothetical protein
LNLDWLVGELVNWLGELVDLDWNLVGGLVRLNWI